MVQDSNMIFIDGAVGLDRGYSCRLGSVDQLMKEYTIRGKEEDFRLYEVDKDSDHVFFPRSILKKIGFSDPNFSGSVRDNRTQGRDLKLDWGGVKFSPREGQEKAIFESLIRLKELGGGLLVAGCGKGKTHMGAMLALELSRSTVVLVHKEFLAEQWEAAFQMLYPGIRVGRIQGDRADSGDDYDVSIALVQSILSAKREYPESLYCSFGFLICDEVHRYGAELWHKAIRRFPGQYRLGLTATPYRADGLMGVVHEHIGKPLFEFEADAIENRVYMVRVDTEIEDSEWQKTWLNDVTRRAKLISLLAAHVGRNKVIVRTILKAHRAGRRCLIISERKSQLGFLAQSIQDEGVPEDLIGFYVGGMKKSEREVARLKPTLFTCLEEAALCLTLGGWKHYTQLVLGESIASYNLERQVIEYVPLLDLTTCDFDGYLAQIDRRRLNVKMTWNHNNIILRKDEELLEKACLLQHHDKVRVSAPVNYPEHGSSIGVLCAELMGGVIAEGSYTVDGRVVLYQNYGRYSQRIDYLISELGWGCSRKEYRPGEISWYFRVGLSKKTFLKWSPDKDLNGFLLGLPQEEVEALFKGLIYGDGSFAPGGIITFTQKKISTIEMFTVLALRCGYSPMVGKDARIGRVYLTKKEFVGLHDQTFHVESARYTGKVWCPRTRNDTWVAMSNGSIFITGNTYQMTKEGLDIEELDALIMATPQARVEQTIGRILRELEGKSEPVTVDFVDSKIEYLRGIGHFRRSQYDHMGCKVLGEF